MMIDRMLFYIPPEQHTVNLLKEILTKHEEIKFVSLVGLDIGGHDTDEKIPISLFLKDMDQILKQGVQTDGSSVMLPKIAELNNAKVDIIPDLDVNWYVDYNYSFLSEDTKLPVGTLRIPSLLVHNDEMKVGSRVILKHAVETFKAGLLRLLKENPYVFSYLDITSVDDIEEIILTAATELEFWVKTPDDKADREQLSTSQILKEQYWKRTIGPVRTALEKSLILLEQYGLKVEMGHKEVGGVKAKLGNSGEFDHVMEQLEIDWGYSNALQAADNENQVKYVVRDVFRSHGLEVTFMAKPMEGVAGNGEHTHMGVSVRLKDGRIVNLFSPMVAEDDFLSPVGFGALMGILKNYEVVNPFVASSNDALNRLKPGFEAPVCIVTSLGHSAKVPSRNRTVLVGLVRDMKNPLATRFELRAPNPKSDTYLVLSAAYLAMLDGIEAALINQKTPEELLASLSKKNGVSDFYLETERAYRSEKDVFEEYGEEERESLFGRAPATVWENLKGFHMNPEKLNVLLKHPTVFDQITIASYEEAVMAGWITELYSRIIPDTMSLVRDCKKIHTDHDCTDFDMLNWKRIQELRVYLGQDEIVKKCLLTRIKQALDAKNYQEASEMQIEMQQKVKELIDTYIEYKKNLL